MATVASSPKYSRKINTNLTKSIPVEEGTVPNSFSEARNTLIPKPEKDNMRMGERKPKSLMNTQTKNPKQTNK